MEKSNQQTEYVHVLLGKCKRHEGPFLCVEELENYLNNIKDEKEQKRVLQEEILYQQHTVIKDAQIRSQLYKVNRLTLTEMKVNFITLLGNHDQTPTELLLLPTEDDLFRIFQNTAHEAEKNIEQPFEPLINEPFIVIWDEVGGRNWYIAMCREKINEEQYMAEHLERLPNDKTKRCWKYPEKTDEQIVEMKQVIPVNLIASWNLKKRISILELDNWHIIEGFFEGLYKH